MKKKNLFLLTISGAAISLAISSGSAAAQTTCDRSTAIQSLSADTLCGCEVVTRDMLRYIQGHEMFEEVLQATSARCPGFAAVLTDQPTASIAGNPNGTNGGGNTLGNDFASGT
ncbi:hypothetical protein, partial [Sedimentimonas flavescens]